MFTAALRPAAFAARSALKPTSSLTMRALSTSAVRRSGPAAPKLFGEGAKPGEVPTDENQSTGLERLQVLGEKEGVDVFDLSPLDSSRIGTLLDPIKVFSKVRTTSFLRCDFVNSIRFHYLIQYLCSLTGHYAHRWMHWFSLGVP